MVTDFCEDLLWAQRDKTSRDFMKYTYKNNNVVIPIQTFRRNLKELNLYINVIKPEQKAITL